MPIVGTSPVIVDETDSKILSQYGIAMPINVKVDKKWEALPGFPTSFSMIQQGFTAQVTCQQLGTNDSLYPTIIVPVGTVNSFLTPFSVMQVVCPNSTEPSQSGPLL
jgi:hypothetical protein